MNGPVCCDSLEQTSCIDDCLLRLMYIVQPFGATTFDFNIPRQRPVIQSDNISMFEQGPNSFNSSNWSNPYTLEMETWTVSSNNYIFCLLTYINIVEQSFIERMLYTKLRNNRVYYYFIGGN